MRLVLDFDSTLVSSIESIIALYNKKYNQKVPKYKATECDWDFRNILPMITEEDIKHFFSCKEFYEYLKPIEGMKELVQELSDKGHDITICSYTDENGFENKRKYIESTFPSAKLILLSHREDCKLDKSCIGKEFDIMIDDNAYALESCNAKIRVLFGWTRYNRDNDVFQRARNAEELKEIIDTYNILRNLGVF